jgi:hypothetical protein
MCLTLAPSRGLSGAQPLPPMRTPTTSPDLTPEQIAEALCELARRDQVAIHLDSHKGQPCHWHVVDSQIIAGTAFDCETRSETGRTYAEALSACRAATFSGGKEK